MKFKLNANNSLRKLFLALFSVFCALLLWVYVTDTEGQNTTKPFNNIVVQFEGESAMRESYGLIVSDISATSARVMVTGNRRTVSALRDSDLGVSVDLSRITRTGHFSMTPNVTFPSRVDSSSLDAVTNPETISFYVDILKDKTLEIEGQFNGSAAEGFVAEPLQFNPGTLIIYGPEQVLAEIDHALVEVNRTEVNRTLTFESTYVLIDKDGNVFESEEITADQQTVSVTLPIHAVKDVSLIVELVDGGGATSSNVRWSLDPDTVTLAGDSETLSGVNNISVARINLAEVTEEGLTQSYKIVIPNDTEITSGVTETTLKLELTGLYQEQFSVGKNNITCTNVSEGYAWEIMSDSIENVVIRGPQEAVKRVSELNIRAVANLTEYGTATGIVYVPVRIEVDGNTEVGAVGEYKVYVNITVAGTDAAADTETEQAAEGETG